MTISRLQAARVPPAKSLATSPSPRPASTVSTGHTAQSSFVAGVPDWAKAPRAAHGEGKFKDQTAQQIASMGFDAIKSASPRELYALRSNQQSGLDAALGGPNGDGFERNLKSLSKDQRRAILRSKIMANIFEETLRTSQRYSKIA